jgi:hypothetical protein
MHVTAMLVAIGFCGAPCNVLSTLICFGHL